MPGSEDIGSRLGGNGHPGLDQSTRITLPLQSQRSQAESGSLHISRQLVSTKELAGIWGVPESTLRYWRSAETGPPYVKLGGRIKYDLADVERYVRANKRMPSVRAHGG